jgi:hypothetical protein
MAHVDSAQELAMNEEHPTQCTAFAGSRRIATGALAVVAVRTKEALDQGEGAAVVVFDDATGKPIDVDLRGSVDDVRRRLAAPSSEPPRVPGRPKLGVVAREVTLLPRHWDWLASQPGGASVTLRKLVEVARRSNDGRDRARRSQEAAYRFMSVLAGDRPGYEEAIRALFAGDRERFTALVELWPADIGAYAQELATGAFEATISLRA